MVMKKLTKEQQELVMGFPAPEAPKEEPQRNGTSAAEVMKRLINERLNGMTFLELALTLAHVMEKKG